ncbi:hypothetical protein RvY_02069 [Ramazzottius varieornatus]|uniref:Uncharacterized protein n=1 Tax=Ramazzottius varieornatus TaxID=947166 RepID=A0A1D1UIJ1_RAMVA|nr:hypothetical protein RvY_02069 [Ramazzottius varieornatus]
MKAWIIRITSLILSSHPEPLVCCLEINTHPDLQEQKDWGATDSLDSLEIRPSCRAPPGRGPRWYMVSNGMEHCAN